MGEKQVVLDVIKVDGLARREEAERDDAHRSILTAAKVIAPMLELSFAEGYDWCIDQVRRSRYGELAAELEITKAVTYLKMKDFKKAVATLKNFENTESKMQSTAGTNLAFLYFLETQYAQAEKCKYIKTL